MANTRTTIKTEVLNKLDNQDLDATTVNSFINQSHREILNKHKWPFMESTFSGTLTASTYIYSLPTTAQQLTTFRITDPTANTIDLTDRYTPFRDFDARHPDPTEDNEGTPDEWTMIGNKFYVWPVPDVVYTIDTRFLKKPTDLVADSTELDTPEEFQELIVLGAAARILERDDSPDEAAVLRAQFDTLLQDMILRYSIRQTGRPMVMKSNKRGGRWNNSGWRL